MSRFLLVMSFHWKDTQPKFIECVECPRYGLEEKVQCWACSGNGQTKINENPPLPEWIVDEMNKHLTHVIANPSIFKLQEAVRLSTDSASL